MLSARVYASCAVVLLALPGCGPHATPSDEGPVGGGAFPEDRTPSKRETPITGGTLSIVSDGRIAIAADPDRDLVNVLRLADGSSIATVTLPSGSHPTRSVENGAGNVDILLRGTGQIATINPTTGALLNIDGVCPEPRGLAWDPNKKATLVACAGGELVTRPLAGSSTTVRPGGELRDVVSDGLGVKLSTFRTPTLTTIASDGTALGTTSPPRVELGKSNGTPVAFEPNTAWKTLSTPGGDTVMVHQWAVNTDVREIGNLAGPAFVAETTTTLEPIIAPGTPYYGAYISGYNTVTHTIEREVCSTGVVRSAITVFNHEGTVVGSKELLGILPVDAAISPNGAEVAVAMAGNHLVTRVQLSQITTVAGSACGLVQPPVPDPTQPGADPIGQVIGVAYSPAGTLVAQSREPNQLVVFAADNTVVRRIGLAGLFKVTPGHSLFHTAAAAVACASCHPEGGEDGKVWNFFGELHRTQTLGGGIASTAPYHWRGTLDSMGPLLADTFVSRMGGTMPSALVRDDLTAFLDAQPARKAPALALADPARVAKGKAVFAAAACTSCHAGDHLTDNLTVDVGTGGSFQVPSLIGVAARAPYMHSGCAPTLRSRFTDSACGGGATHGSASTLAPEDLDSLIEYLQTL